MFISFLTGEMQAGFVQFRALVGGVQLSFVELYKLISRDNTCAAWAPDYVPTEWTETGYIIDPVLFKRLPNGNVAFYHVLSAS